MMTDKDRRLIIDLSLQKITSDKFIDYFNFKGENIKDYILKVLREGYFKKNEEDIEYGLLMYFSLNRFNFDKSNIIFLGNLLLEKWHNSHEDIVMIMQKLKDPSSIPFLEKAIYLNLDYLSYNNNESLIRKCAFALGDINTPESKEVINKLLQSDNEIVKKVAIEQSNRLTKF